MRPERWIYKLPLRIRSLFDRQKADEELDEELRDHLDQKAQQFIAQGMSAQQARRGQRAGQCQRRAATPRGPIQLPQRPIGFGQIGMKDRQTRPQRDGPADEFDRLAMIPALVLKHPQQMQRRRVLLIAGQGLLVKSRRGVEPSGFVQFDGCG